MKALTLGEGPSLSSVGSKLEASSLRTLTGICESRYFFLSFILSFMTTILLFYFVLFEPGSHFVAVVCLLAICRPCWPWTFVPKTSASQVYRLTLPCTAISVFCWSLLNLNVSLHSASLPIFIQPKRGYGKYDDNQLEVQVTAYYGVDGWNRGRWLSIYRTQLSYWMSKLESTAEFPGVWARL